MERSDSNWNVANKATGWGDTVWKAFHGSIDAAKALREALGLPIPEMMFSDAVDYQGTDN